MTITDYSIEKFLKDRPDASLREFVDDLKEKQKCDEQRERERRENEIQWYKDHAEGKYFLITFHYAAHTFLGPIPKDIWSSSNKFIPCINVYTNTSNKGVRVETEERYINLLWLQNPYSKDVDKCNVKCKEISKEEFDSVRDSVSQMILDISKKW